MELQIAGTNLELSTETKQYIERKLGKLDKHLPDIIDMKVEVSREKTRSPRGHFLVRVTVNSGIGGTFHGEERAEDTTKAVDKLVAVMARQMEKQKGKLYDRGRGNPLARGKYGPPGGSGSARKIIKTKRFVMEPMPREEAIEQMENLGHDFFLFQDSDTGEICLLYRRYDGNYGIIETESR